MKKTVLWVAGGGVAALLALWVLHPGAEVETVPRVPKKGGAAQEVARHGGSDTPAALPASVPARPDPPTGGANSQEIRLTSSKPAAPPGPPGGAWDHLAYLKGVPGGRGEAGRLEAIRLTAVHLRIQPARQAEFEEAARQSASEMEQALDRRGRDLSTLAPVEGSAVPDVSATLSEQRYLEARSKALGRLETFLTRSPTHQVFRWAFDSWISTVAVKGRTEAR